MNVEISNLLLCSEYFLVRSKILTKMLTLNEILTGKLEKEEVLKKNYDERDELVIEKLRNNEIDTEEVLKNLEKLYKGMTDFIFLNFLFIKLFHFL